jgi:type II secretory ATPase GspE/PulE/Tfp pilus assembly ATPase PilB-like protein
VLEVNDAVRKAIAEEAPLQEIWYETFGRNGGSLWDDAREKVRQGLTTVEEVAWALTDYPHPHTGMDTALGSRDALEID